MIGESYVSLDTARILKEAGFDVPTSTHYSNSGEVWQSSAPEDYNDDKSCKACSRPTQALAARWLREVHGIVVDVVFETPKRGKDWRYFIGDMEVMVWAGDFIPSDGRYDTYEEAMEDALQEALRLIIKNKSDD